MTLTPGHDCIVKGCKGLALYGLGSARKGVMRFACAAHRGLLQGNAARSADTDLPAALPSAVRLL